VAGAKEVTMARPDGYTLGFFSTGVVTTQYTVPTPTDLKDYEPISFINMDPAALAVNANSPFKTLEDLVSYAKKNPEKLNFGIAPGSSNHIMTAIFAKAAGLKLYFVPFKGGGERSVALAGKHIDADMDVPAIYKSLVEAGKVRILGVASEKRVSLYKELPTFREQGVDCVTGSWHGVFAPKGTPKEVLSIVEKALEKTSKNPNFVEVMHKANIGVHYMNREEFIRFLEKEDVRIKEIVKELDIK
jgi:tripartite-type tricarboxylate transporter receptor subunit TctC